MEKQTNFFHNLGVYGFKHVEPLIIAALVSEDPILLIGKSGTGKTFLLNSISEAMGLEHRHYNASLISFDDLIGFPFPAKDKKSIEFLPTPATIWDAESVLVDELSRCKPETQNKFFSIVHERKVQGIELNKLRYRWAAMNPVTFDGSDGDDNYEGCQPLDQALADRFAFIIVVPDWPDLNTQEQEAVIYPAGEAAISNDNGCLKSFIEKIKPVFLENITHPSTEIVTYCRFVTSILTGSGYRISPRRARLLARNLTAVCCVAEATGNNLNQETRKKLFKLALQWSLPHRAWKDTIPGHLIDTAHSEACLIAFTTTAKEKWISEFNLSPALDEKINKLFDDTIDTDTKSLAVIQMLTKESKTRAAIFTFSAFPFLSKYSLLNEEAQNELARIVKSVFDVDGELSWTSNNYRPSSQHPTLTSCLKTINNLPKNEKNRINRAKQFFYYLLSKKEEIPEPDYVENELNNCFNRIKAYATQYKISH